MSCCVVMTHDTVTPWQQRWLPQHNDTVSWFNVTWCDFMTSWHHAVTPWLRVTMTWLQHLVTLVHRIIFVTFSGFHHGLCPESAQQSGASESETLELYDWRLQTDVWHKVLVESGYWKRQTVIAKLFYVCVRKICQKWRQRQPFMFRWVYVTFFRSLSS